MTKKYTVEQATLLIAERLMRADIAKLGEIGATQFFLLADMAISIISALHWSHLLDGLALADELEQRMKAPELAEMVQIGELSELLAARVRDAVLSLPLDNPERPLPR